eukprot:Selendium_serpulae@DN1583_c0_g1_i1.p1
MMVFGMGFKTQPGSRERGWVSQLDTSASFDAVFLFFASSAFGLNVIQILICAMCSLWGPGKALRGEGVEAFETTIAILRRCHAALAIFFELGLLAYLITSILATLAIFPFYCALALAPLIAWMGYVLKHQHDILTCAFIPTVVTSPQFISSDVNDAVQNIGLLMATGAPKAQEPHEGCQTTTASTAVLLDTR